MDEKIITQFEINVLVQTESVDEIKRVFKSHGVEITSEKTIQKIRLSYDIKKQQYAFFVTFEASVPKHEEKELRADLSKIPEVVRVLITEKKEKKVNEKRSTDETKRPSRLKSALQAMLPNEALEKKIEEILQ
ncbi:hypothetical protein C4565_08505 [Candidatus Parcubacteria bacterium]|jgi:ribosomal protein S6|nr:MAG: hypothetical protein C4565_08505 [Candidatus Parcubacteria bacterium]